MNGNKWYLIGVILVFVGFCLICGCSGEEEQLIHKAGVEGGVTGVPSDVRINSTFEDAMVYLESANVTGELDTTGMKIYMVAGKGIDEQGNARSWILYTRQNESAYLYIYDRLCWNRLEWSGPMPDGEIDMADIIMPSEFYSMNSDAIREATEAMGVDYSDLQLEDGTYKVIVRSPVEMSIIPFDAYSGEMIESKN